MRLNTDAITLAKKYRQGTWEVRLRSTPMPPSKQCKIESGQGQTATGFEIEMKRTQGCVPHVGESET